MSTTQFPQFQHHGAIHGTTGSCHRFIANESNHILVDCGLFQGRSEQADTFAQHHIDFDITAVKALVVTHVHIDHVGRLPYLLAAGFTGPIICSVPSAKLLPLVIEDALKIGFTRDARLIEQFLEKVGKQLVPVVYKQWHQVVSEEGLELRVRLQRAGHILGSAYVEVDAVYSTHSYRAVFSGDLGAPHAPLLPAPKSPLRADALVIESTYGNRLHENRRERQQKLKVAIEHALLNQGTVLIPAFSIGRTQELLYELEDLIAQGGTGEEAGNSHSRWRDLEIIVDSPLAARFTEVYRELKPYWDAEAQQRVRAGRHPLSFDNLYTVDSHAEHEQTVAYLVKTRRPAVVLAASGMVSGGRIMNYMKAMLEDEHHAVLFVGYQAKGTPGRAIQEYGPRNGWVEIDGTRYDIKAEVTSIGGYSAHADQKDLVNFVKRMRHWPKEIRIVHGEGEAREALRDKFNELGQSCKHTFDIVLPE